jgi:hypothetical protein
MPMNPMIARWCSVQSGRFSSNTNHQHPIIDVRLSQGAAPELKYDADEQWNPTTLAYYFFGPQHANTMVTTNAHLTQTN